MVSRDFRWLAAAALVAVLWFGFNRLLPPLFRGDVCCDSVGYVTTASRSIGKPDPTALSGQPAIEPASLAERASRVLRQAFTYTGYSPPGYPLFLAAHRFAFQLLRLDGLVSWLSMSFVTALVLHLGASFFFFRSLRLIGLVLHPAALFLIAVHPGLVSHAAIPLADGLAITFMMAGVGCLCRALGHPRHAWLHSLVGGFFLALTVFTRTSHLPAALFTLIGWMIFAMSEKCKMKSEKLWFMLLLPTISLIGFLAVLSPRLIACARQTGTLCYSLPADQERMTGALIRNGMEGARTYSILAPGFSKLVTVPDTFFTRLSASCPMSTAAPLRDLFGCLLRHPLDAGVYLAKKSIGLFDNFHLNTYATHVTPFWVIILNRIFGALGFAGFLFLIADIIRRLRRKEWSLMRVAPFLYPLLYFSYSILLMIESRYGLPLAPFGMVGAVFLIQTILKRRRYATTWAVGGFALAVLFIVQTSLWDRIDPYPDRSIAEGIRSDIPPPDTGPPLVIAE